MSITKKGIEVMGQGLAIVDKLAIDQDDKMAIKQDIINNEINSDSKFLKMARPSIIYVGLLLIILEILGMRLFLLSKMEATEIMLKSSNAIFEYFLFTWGGIASVYAIGRTYEKQKRRIITKKNNKKSGFLSRKKTTE